MCRKYHATVNKSPVRGVDNDSLERNVLGRQIGFIIAQSGWLDVLVNKLFKRGSCQFHALMAQLSNALCCLNLQLFSNYIFDQILEDNLISAYCVSGTKITSSLHLCCSNCTVRWVLINLSRFRFIACFVYFYTYGLFASQLGKYRAFDWSLNFPFEPVNIHVSFLSVLSLAKMQLN